LSNRMSGSNPVLQASASSTAQMLVATSAARAPPSLAWVKPSANRVRACISSKSSGRSTRGKRAVTAALSATRLGGSSIFSRAVSTSSPPSIVTSALPGRFAAVIRYAASRRSDNRESSAGAFGERPSVRQMAGRADSQAGPDSSPRRGSAKRRLGEVKRSRRRIADRIASSRQRRYAILSIEPSRARTWRFQPEGTNASGANADSPRFSVALRWSTASSTSCPAGAAPKATTRSRAAMNRSLPCWARSSAK